MGLFKKRETPIQNIAYMAIMAAINIVFVLLCNILPVLLFLLVFILPLTSVIVTIYCKKKYFPIYFIVTLLLCFAVTSGFSVFDTFIYVLPSLVTGFIFGICFEKNVPAIITLTVATIAEYLLTILTFFVLGRIVSNLNMTETIVQVFGLANWEFKAVFIEVFLYTISLIQILISFAFVKYQSKILGIEINLKCQFQFLLYLFTLACGGFAIISYFYFPVYTLVIVLIALPIYIYECVVLVLKREIWIWISLALVHILFPFVFALLYQCLVAPNQLIIIYILFGIVTIIDFLSNYCLKQNTNNIK